MIPWADTRAGRLRMLLDVHGEEQDAQGTSPTADKRYALVETSHAHDWVTTFDEPDDALEYHFGQEGIDLWTIVKLVDLDTGAEYDEYVVEAHFVMDDR